jgi:hypothetical protein
MLTKELQLGVAVFTDLQVNVLGKGWKLKFKVRSGIIKNVCIEVEAQTEVQAQSELRCSCVVTGG